MSEIKLQNEYNLPFKSNQDSITLLARDPNWLYAYWEISEEKRNLMIHELGNDFYEKSVPTLKVTNISRNEYTFVRINEFSNDWYINVQDANNIYIIEIGRRISENFFISILNSNSVVTPGNSESVNTSVSFVKYSDLRDGKKDMINSNISDVKVIANKASINAASSSQEFYRTSNKEEMFGISSFQILNTEVKG